MKGGNSLATAMVMFPACIATLYESAMVHIEYDTKGMYMQADGTLAIRAIAFGFWPAPYWQTMSKIAGCGREVLEKTGVDIHFTISELSQ